MRALYLCYFGLREPLVQTQVLPYLRELVKGGVEMELLTFEAGGAATWRIAELKSWQEQLAGEGIRWHSLKYHKWPSLPATLWDVLAGVARIVRLANKKPLDVIHARAHIPLAMALPARLLTGARIIFDIRGLIPDEYVDAGIWREASMVYRAMKRLEKLGIRRSDQLVVLTERMRDWLVEAGLAGREKIEVIPCCVDVERFAGVQSKQGNRFELVYAGSVTGLYLLEEMAGFFQAVRGWIPEAFLRILTASPADETRSRLKQFGLDESWFWVGRVSPDEIPVYLAAARVGLSFRKATFSQIAASPTKIPEYLGAGIPVVSNAGIGDTDKILEKARVGVIIREMNSTGFETGVARLKELMVDQALSDRCREAAREWFDLETVGGARYRRVYRRIQNSTSAGNHQG